MSTLEERVAALEARYAPVHLTYSTMPLTEAQEAELRESAAEALKLGPPPPRPAPEPPPLAPAQVRYLLRQCVTVVKPGETLVIRVPATWPQGEVREYAETIFAQADYLKVPFWLIVAAAEELAVAEPAS